MGDHALTATRISICGVNAGFLRGFCGVLEINILPAIPVAADGPISKLRRRHRLLEFVSTKVNGDRLSGAISDPAEQAVLASNGPTARQSDRGDRHRPEADGSHPTLHRAGDSADTASRHRLESYKYRSSTSCLCDGTDSRVSLAWSAIRVKPAIVATYSRRTLLSAGKGIIKLVIAVALRFLVPPD